MRKFYSIIWTATLMLAFIAPAWAGFSADPAEACNFLRAEGLATRGSYAGSGDIHRCSSNRKNLVSGGQMNNSIRFTAQGNAEKVTQLRLELQVNSRSGVQRSHGQLVDYATSLLNKALDASMPEDLKAAILGAVQGSWEINGSTVALKRITSGRAGYELRLIID